MYFLLLSALFYLIKTSAANVSYRPLQENMVMNVLLLKLTPGAEMMPASHNQKVVSVK